LVEIGSVVSEERIFLNFIKIEISSNDQNCSILSQKVPKFELYKHNDELFNSVKIDKSSKFIKIP
jgi:hypothetical protein